ncbi:MAG TPA: copper resistance protein B [Burkholderiales bacterium]
MRRLLLFVPLLWLQSASGQDPYPLPPREWPQPVMDRELFAMVLLERLEYRAQSGDDGWLWDGQAWYGGDRYRLWLKSEGEGEVGGRAESADVQALLARRISPYWHLQAGVREALRPRPSRTSGVVALQGLAPYWLELDASLFFGDGPVSGRVEAEYDQPLTQRWIVQPRLEATWSGDSDAERGVRSGLGEIELGLRLRYEMRREFAPYAGVSWTHRVGAGSDSALVLGLRAWY